MPSYLYVEDDALSRKLMNMILGKIMQVEMYHIFEDSKNILEQITALPKAPDILRHYGVGYSRDSDFAITRLHGYKMRDEWRLRNCNRKSETCNSYVISRFRIVVKPEACKTSFG